MNNEHKFNWNDRALYHSSSAKKESQHQKCPCAVSASYDVTMANQSMLLRPLVPQFKSLKQHYRHHQHQRPINHKQHDIPNQRQFVRYLHVRHDQIHPARWIVPIVLYHALAARVPQHRKHGIPIQRHVVQRKDRNGIKLPSVGHPDHLLVHPRSFVVIKEIGRVHYSDLDGGGIDLPESLYLIEGVVVFIGGGAQGVGIVGSLVVGAGADVGLEGCHFSYSGASGVGAVGVGYLILSIIVSFVAIVVFALLLLPSIISGMAGYKLILRPVGFAAK
mmetsp:Transcript_6742/g.10981  ORF Transcript_6742/g.10981 Transcript_6742/m.10981 type:complete len:276 (-) Transcript_6742:8-835(-)